MGKNQLMRVFLLLSLFLSLFAVCLVETYQSYGWLIGEPSDGGGYPDISVNRLKMIVLGAFPSALKKMIWNFGDLHWISKTAIFGEGAIILAGLALTRWSRGNKST